jgi:C1A family cysteine protease
MKGYLQASKKEISKPRNLQSQNVILPKVYPRNFDWRDYEEVSSVKEQGLCGAAWVYSTAAFFESELVRRNMSNN